MDPEYERLMEAAVKAHAQREGFRDCLEENNLELFFSRYFSVLLNTVFCFVYAYVKNFFVCLGVQV